jgi:dTDP-4-dehydrorhamnose 3,5-epimerase/CDP-3, 6-dideoxy-D-glycero-D-glycero-4-hexulose-5-epimerase
MISFNSTEIKDVFVIDNFHSEDIRGTFVKTYNSERLAAAGFDEIFRESYYSKSHKNVIRGMHFQIPPHDHEKLVYVTEGEIMDVVLDLAATQIHSEDQFQ